jgi:hypothetical protein
MVIRKSRFHANAKQQGLFSANKGQDGFAPYLLGNKRYPLLSLLMTSHRNGETKKNYLFYKKKHRRGRSVVENAFDILKKTFHELQKLHVFLVPNLVCYYCLLHNC